MNRWSIIIPVYRHADMIVRCLRSLEKQTHSIDELIIVDDGSPEPVSEELAKYTDLPPYTLIRLDKNQGSPAARNEGFRHTTGDIVLFLDADVELIPTALAQWDQVFEEHPEAAFAYSAFRFGWKRFASQPFSLEVLRQTNYIHTSSPIRRAFVPMFDESLKKFQDWDLWLQIAHNGGSGIYVANELFTVAPRSKWEMSQWLPAIAHRLPWQLSPWQPKEIKRYRVADRIIRAKWQLPEKPTLSKMGQWLLAIGLFEILSFAVVFFPHVNALITICLASLLVGLAYKRPTLALSGLAAELIIGSKGALFKAFGNNVNDGGVSIRLLGFAAFFLGWMLWAWPRRQEGWSMVKAFFREHWAYVLLAAALLLGVMRGFWFHQPFLTVDANAWGYWLLIVPVITLVTIEKEALQRDLVPAITAAFLWLIAKTLVLFYLFSHAFPAWLLDPVYLWVRRTGVGELTRASGSIFRVFFQSHFYLVFAWLLIAVRRWVSPSRDSWRWFAVWIATSAALLVSLSRSLTLGWLVGMSCVFAAGMWYAGKQKTLFSQMKKMVSDLFLVLLGSCAIVAVIAVFPLPSSDASLGQTFLDRIDQQGAGVTSRRQLLPYLRDGIRVHPLLGSGFGATLTYPTTDPRIIEKTGGLYTTYAFEWGWLDVWLKLGLFGVLACFTWLFSLARSARFLSEEKRWFIWSCLLALAVIHTFTPYFNHPLGIGLLVAFEGYLQMEKVVIKKNTLVGAS